MKTADELSRELDKLETDDENLTDQSTYQIAYDAIDALEAAEGEVSYYENDAATFEVVGHAPGSDTLDAVRRELRPMMAELVELDGATRVLIVVDLLDAERLVALKVHHG